MPHRAGTGALRSWRPRAWALAAFLFALPAAAADLDAALDALAAHYGERFPGAIFTGGLEPVAGCGDARRLETEGLLGPSTGPLVFDHGEVREHAVVLTHGLSDSPFFLCALALRLYEAGANVVLPLLTGHGRSAVLPEGNSDDLVLAWQQDALAGLEFAAQRGERVSTGGLSTGGVLAAWLWTERPETVDGGILLFSAAFDFSTRLRLAAACAGTPAERDPGPWWRRWCYDFLADRARSAEASWIWTLVNPYRIAFSEFQALHLGFLRRETVRRLETQPLSAPLFVAHSVADQTAPIAGVDALVAGHAAPERVVRMTLDDTRRANCRELMGDCSAAAPPAAACGIPHSSVVLQSPIRAPGNGAICEVANPLFDAMAEAAVAFLRELPPADAP